MASAVPPGHRFDPGPAGTKALTQPRWARAIIRSRHYNPGFAHILVQKIRQENLNSAQNPENKGP
jgi:hypothetical protein